MKRRVNWISRGKRNTSHFHKSVIINRSSNRIMVIRTVGEDLVDPIRIRNHITSAF